MPRACQTPDLALSSLLPCQHVGSCREVPGICGAPKEVLLQRLYQSDLQATCLTNSGSVNHLKRRRRGVCMCIVLASGDGAASVIRDSFAVPALFGQ